MEGGDISWGGVAGLHEWGGEGLHNRYTQMVVNDGVNTRTLMRAKMLSMAALACSFIVF